MNELQQAEQIVQAARARLNELQEEHFNREVLPKMQARIGHCFKYRNSYSCPRKASDYWYVYHKIVGVVDGEYETVSIAKDSNGDFQIRTSSAWSPRRSGTDELMEGFIPISLAEFGRETSALVSQINTVLPPLSLRPKSKKRTCIGGK